MDWILEKSLELYQSLVKGELTLEQVFTILIPLILVGTFLARKSIFEFINSQFQRIKEYIRLQEAQEAVRTKQKRASILAKEIEEKLYELQEIKGAFSLKMSELLGRIEDPAFSTEKEDKKRTYLKDNILHLDGNYKKSLNTVKDIENLLKDIAEIKRAEVWRRNSKQMMTDARKKAQSRRVSKNRQGK